MIESATVTALIAKYGIAMLLPLTIIGGPPVIIAAAYMARLSLLNVNEVLICVIAADILGDGIYYGVGRMALNWLPHKFRESIGVTPARVEQISQTFAENGTRVLVISKLTQVAGFAVLLSAGAAHMPFGRFMLINLLVAIPKSLVLVGVGYFFGGANELIVKWFSTFSIAGAVILCILVLFILYKKRKASA